MADDSTLEYNDNVESFRENEYPMIGDDIYLDHAGTTLYSKSLVESFASDMITNLYGNPHSASSSSQSSTKRVEDTRLKALRFFNADPDLFDFVFVANATAGMKLVMDAFQSQEGGFSFVYHRDSHTSLIGIRENANESVCLGDDDIERWLDESHPIFEQQLLARTTLFAYPGQSNMNGRRLPLRWCHEAQNQLPSRTRNYTLLDVAALVSTSPLDLSNAVNAPDFCVLSFNKIFGFPDLGGLIVKKSSGSVLRSRRYFGGGTVELVICDSEQACHVSKEQTLHEVLEDGTLPIHSIMALDKAMAGHRNLYGSMEKVAKHTIFLARRLYNGLRELRHLNGLGCCRMYSQEEDFGTENTMQGPLVAFNLRSADGRWISNSEVEKLAAVKGIHVRTGGLCNPGGIATALEISPQELRKNYSAGFRCGGDNDIMNSGKPTGVIRASIGAMSTISDIDRFLAFIREFYTQNLVAAEVSNTTLSRTDLTTHFVESLTIYPIKSCGGFDVPTGVDWQVKSEGLAWDREWCLVHQGTGQALSQKRYPRMALFRPSIDLDSAMLDVRYIGDLAEQTSSVSIPLASEMSLFDVQSRDCASRVCGDAITARTYLDPAINAFFSEILQVPCVLARFPAGGSGPSTRHAKAHMQRHQRTNDTQDAGGPPTPPDSDNESSTRPILLSNESPILLVNKDSLCSLNSVISKSGGKIASASVFRANILIASKDPSQNQAYSEDHWTGLRIGREGFKMLGSCRRCHMICVDQDTAVKDEEPFVSLAKTRRFDGKIFFGSHMCHVHEQIPGSIKSIPTIRVGDAVAPIGRGA